MRYDGPRPVRDLKALFTLALAVGLLSGCKQQSGEAIVLGKEHIAAAASDTPSPAASAEPASSSADDSSPPEIRPMAPDEIAVDSYVMKPEVRGTSRDPRALHTEQWLVKLRLVSDGRTFNVPTDQSQFGRLHEGDRVKVIYRVGKYTGTVWDAQITELRK